MAQGTLTRLTYERLGILLTDAPAYKERGSQYTDLIRVQSMDYGFTHQALDIKAIGSDKLVTRNGQSPVVRAPDVNCNIEYLFAEGQNEIGAGLHVGKDGSVLKNFFDSTTTDDINILVVASSEDENRELNFLTSESDFENYNVIGIGNAYLTSYSYNAAVGQFPTSSLSYAGSNMKYDVYSSSARPTLPAIKPGINNIESSEEVYIDRSQMRDVSHDREGDGHVFDEHHDPEISTTKPGDIKVTITKNSGARGGAKLDEIHAAIQSLSVDLPINRQDIYGMGSNYVFNRKLKLPIIGSLSVDMIVRGYEPDAVDSFLTEADTYDLIIEHPVEKRIVGDKGETYIADSTSTIYRADQNHQYYPFVPDETHTSAFVYLRGVDVTEQWNQGYLEISQSEYEGLRSDTVFAGADDPPPVSDPDPLPTNDSSTGSWLLDENLGYIFYKASLAGWIYTITYTEWVYRDENAPDYIFSSNQGEWVLLSEYVGTKSIHLGQDAFSQINLRSIFYYIAVEENDWRRIPLVKIDRAQSGSKGDTGFSDDGNFYYVCLGGTEWGKIPLTSSNMSSVDDIVYTYTFVHLNNNGTWMKFPVSELNFDVIDFEAAFDVAQNMTFEINRAQLKSQNYTHSIGSEVMVSSSLTFDVTRTDGFRMYFQ